MLIVTVRYTLKDGTRDEFYKKVLDNRIIEESKIESGNLKYDYYYPLDCDNSVCLMELWTDAEAQKAHGLTEHYQRLSKLKAKYVIKTEIIKYETKENA